MAASTGVVGPAAAQEPPLADYYVYVGAESADLLHRIRFGPGGAVLDRTIPVGEIAVETEGPHGLNVSPDGRFLFMTTGHGVPDGKLWKFHAGPDTLVGDPILLGYFPATLDLTPDGLYAFVANFNLHGEMVPSSVSVVYTPEMIEVEQIETCTMPHGARMDAAGTFLYSACMMDDQAGRALAVARSSTTVTHGVAVSSDRRYAYVSVEGVGAEPGKVDIFDLRDFSRMAEVEVGQQAGGIVFWKMESIAGHGGGTAAQPTGTVMLSSSQEK